MFRSNSPLTRWSLFLILINMKNIIIVIGILAIAAAGVYVYLERDSGKLVFGDPGVSQTVIANTEIFIARRVILESLVIDLDVLDDVRFTSLRSFTRKVENVPQGRPNPFIETTVRPGR